MEVFIIQFLFSANKLAMLIRIFHQLFSINSSEECGTTSYQNKQVQGVLSLCLYARKISFTGYRLAFFS
jgi:hypothetical protein